MQPNPPGEGRTHRILFDRLIDFRLKTCMPLDGVYQTYRHNRGAPFPCRLDYLFVSETATIISAAVINDQQMT